MYFARNHSNLTKCIASNVLQNFYIKEKVQNSFAHFCHINIKVPVYKIYNYKKYNFKIIVKQ